MSICGEGQQCPALAQSRFGLHVQGDSWGSNRLMDTILSGTVPIFTRRGQHRVVPSWYNWTIMSSLLPYEDFEDNSTGFLIALKDIIHDEKGYHEKQKAVLQNKPLFDWTTLHPFDTYMYMLQAHLYPETRHPPDAFSEIWPVLILPPRNVTT